MKLNLTRIVTRIVTSMALVAAVFGTTLAINNKEVLADTNAKAVSVNAKISVDGASSTQLLVYNVDGNNYYRIADVGRLLDYQILYTPVDKAMLELYKKEIAAGTIKMDTKDTITVIPSRTYNTKGGVTSEILPLATTSKTVNVVIKDMNMAYDGIKDTITCFNVDGYNYFKLVDIKKVVDKKVNMATTLAISAGKNSSTLYQDSVMALDVKYDDFTRVTSLYKNKVDLKAIYTNAGGKVTATPAPTAKPVVTPAPTVKPVVTTPVVTVAPTPAPVVPTEQPTETELPSPNAPVKVAPAVGSIPAKILINASLGAYDASGNVLLSNLMPIYKSYTGQFGQCTWYALNRMTEVTGINIIPEFSGGGNGVAAAYANITTSYKLVKTSPNISTGSIAVWNGHIAFVEFVERDSQGVNPVNVYFTEANVGNTKDGLYRPSIDGVVKKMSYQAFTTKSSTGNIIGYISLK